MGDMRTAACASLSCLTFTPPSRGESPSSAPPTSAATASGIDVTVDARGEDGRRQRGLLHAAMDGDLDLVARMAAELQAAARNGTGPTAGGVWSTCGHNALHLAAANGTTHVCRYLVQDLGFPVDARARSSSADTPLTLAASFGHTATAAYLLDCGADPRAPDSDGETPLHWAACNGDRELAMLLPHRGADVGAANPRGTALHVAAFNAHTEVIVPFVKCLLEAGANPNGLDELGRPPIEVAAFHAETELVEVLFPVTRRPAAMLDWSVAGIVRHVNSASYQERVIKLKASNTRRDELKQQGHSAFKRNDYSAAISLYSVAMRFGDRDATLYSDRSICWLREGNGEQALSDAQACIEMRPNWANSYYCQGMSFHLLKDRASADEAFLKAKELDQEYADIK